jgi:cytochrome c551
MKSFSDLRRSTAARTALAISIVTLGGLLGAGCGGGDGGGDEPSGGDTGGSSAAAPDTDSAAIALFDSAGCAGCHVFSVADASGPVGPNLDDTTMSKTEIEARIANGGGGMPAYEDELSSAEISSLAGLIADSN